MDFSFLLNIPLSVLSIIVVFALTKLIGNKQMSQLNMFDYIYGITIGSIAAEMATDIENFEKPLTAMIIYGIIGFLVSLLSIKSVKIRQFVWDLLLYCIITESFTTKILKKQDLMFMSFFIRREATVFLTLPTCKQPCLSPTEKSAFFRFPTAVRLLPPI